MDWSNIEVETIISDYFSMLSLEISGKSYSKAEHRRALLPLLNNRSEGSIEFKHQNISAVLIKLGQPYIKGYLPRYNYQRILEEKVIEYLSAHSQIENHFESFASRQIFKPELDYENLLVSPPASNIFHEPSETYSRSPIKVNYLEKEQNNAKLGMFGEEIVMEYERRSLIKMGKANLAEKVEWISQEKGDGLGFDILSRYGNGKDKYIEVKTTKLSKESPFFFTRNEMLFSLGHKSDYHLYRLFDVDKRAKMFVKQGDLKTICHSVPISFKGFF
ncbi:MAG: DUF3883 domain-containing protein [Bacteroidales bacterium]|nr:DUF3883 domain-containing protein [Bacteroidales bacterium]MCF8387946.1 DUF3883 domain-containing protein [Bacteroidales bacterium]MCF8399057.1 DUF3883 domain-containing protein [Bacteroidales bacterium]